MAMDSVFPRYFHVENTIVFAETRGIYPMDIRAYISFGFLDIGTEMWKFTRCRLSLEKL